MKRSERDAIRDDVVARNNDDKNPDIIRLRRQKLHRDELYRREHPYIVYVKAKGIPWQQSGRYESQEIADERGKAMVGSVISDLHCNSGKVHDYDVVAHDDISARILHGANRNPFWSTELELIVCKELDIPADVPADWTEGNNAATSPASLVSGFTFRRPDGGLESCKSFVEARREWLANPDWVLVNYSTRIVDKPSNWREQDALWRQANELARGVIEQMRTAVEARA